LAVLLCMLCCVEAHVISACSFKHNSASPLYLP